MSIHRGELLDGPDRLGNYTYFLFWMADYHPGHPDGEYRRAERGQVFHDQGDPINDKSIVWEDKRH